MAGSEICGPPSIDSRPATSCRRGAPNRSDPTGSAGNSLLQSRSRLGAIRCFRPKRSQRRYEQDVILPSAFSFAPGKEEQDHLERRNAGRYEAAEIAAAVEPGDLSPQQRHAAQEQAAKFFADLRQSGRRAAALRLCTRCDAWQQQAVDGFKKKSLTTYPHGAN